MIKITILFLTILISQKVPNSIGGETFDEVFQYYEFHQDKFSLQDFVDFQMDHSDSYLSNVSPQQLIVPCFGW